MQRAGRSALADQITDSAAALAYYTFLAIPATLLVGIGVFGLVASPSDVTSLMQRLQGTVPDEVITLVQAARSPASPRAAAGASPHSSSASCSPSGRSRAR